jgi:hypothetical protein
MDFTRSTTSIFYIDLNLSKFRFKNPLHVIPKIASEGMQLKRCFGWDLRKYSFDIAVNGLYLCFSINNTMTTLNELNAISPIDGRYRVKPFLCSLFSEALIKYRVLVEIEYFIALRTAATATFWRKIRFI